jgi:hypothetical protein
LAFERFVADEKTLLLGVNPKLDVDDIARELTALAEAETTKGLRKSLFANCWHISEVESGAMWGTYGRDGVAVRSTIRSLAECLLPTGHTYEIHPIRYVDHAVDDFSSEISWRFKHKLYSYEQELRAVLFPEILYTPDPGILVEVEINSLIHGVHLPPGAGELQRGVVRSLTEKYRLADIPIVPSVADTIPPYRTQIHDFLNRLEHENFDHLLNEVTLKLREQQQ